MATPLKIQNGLISQFSTTDPLNVYAVSVTTNVTLGGILRFMKGGGYRWFVNFQGTETGFDAGSDLVFTGFADDGTTPSGGNITFYRANGNAAFSGTVDAAGYAGHSATLTQLVAGASDVLVLADSTGTYSTDFNLNDSTFALRHDVNVVSAPNACLSFNATSANYVSCGGLGLSAWPANGTVCFWVKTPAAWGTSRGIFSSSDGSGSALRAFMDGNGQLTTYLNGGSGSLTAAGNSLGTNYHFAVTWAGTSWTLYRNGVSVSTASAVVPSAFTTWVIGRIQAGDAYAWSGQVDDFRVYNVALSQAQVQQVYNGGAGNEAANLANLIACWQFNEGVGTSLADISGNGNTATCNGTPTWVAGGCPQTAQTSAVSTATVIASSDGVAGNEVGTHTFGDAGGGTRLQGMSVKVYTLGAFRGVIDSVGRWGVNDVSPSGQLSVATDGTLAGLVIKAGGTQKDLIDAYVSGVLKFSVSPAGVVTGDGSGLTNLNASNLATGTVNTARLGSGTASQYSFLSGANTWLKPLGSGLCQGRLTLTSGSPVPADTSIAAGGTLYYTPYAGNKIALFNGTDWDVLTLAQLSLTTGTTATCYDVFAYASGGMVYLEQLAWTNYVSRATALAWQDGVLVKSGAATRRYLGTYAVSPPNILDNAQYRLVWNYYNRVPRRIYFTNPGSGSYTQSVLATWRPQNNSAASFIAVVVGVAEEPTFLKVNGFCQPDTAYAVPSVNLSMDSYDGTTGFVGGLTSHLQVAYANAQTSPFSTVMHPTPVGYHAYFWMERIDGGSGTCLWYGSGGSLWQAGIEGTIRA